MAEASDGSVLIADFGNNRIRRVSPAGIITTAAGTGQVGIAGDDGPASAAALSPYGVAAAADGSVYIADYHDQLIRRVSPGGIITTVAGGGTGKLIGDGGPAKAAVIDPYGVAIAGDGSVLIADAGSNRIRRVSRSGLITTVAGAGWRH